MSQWKELMHRFGIAVTPLNKGEKGLSCYQMIRSYLSAKQAGRSITLQVDDGNAGEAEKFADFLRSHREALEDVSNGFPQEFYAGNATLSRDKKTLYLFEYSVPSSYLMVKGIRNKIISISLLASGKGLNRDGSVGLGGSPGTLWIQLPEESVEPDCTVIKVALKGELELFRGIGAPITQN